MLVTRMFVRYYTYITAPGESSIATVRGNVRSWLPALASDAEESAGELVVDVGPSLGRAGIKRRAEVSCGEPVQVGDALHVPISWHAAAQEELFPTLSGELEVLPVGARHTKVALSANYDPPLKPVGKWLDSAFLHLIGEATVKDFVDRVAARLSDRVDVSEAVKPD